MEAADFSCSVGEDEAWGRAGSPGLRPQGRAGPRARGEVLRREGGRGGGGVIMADAVLDAVRRELREFPAAARGEWGGSSTAEQLRDAGGALGLPRTGSRIRVRPVLPGLLAPECTVFLFLKGCGTSCT